MDAGGLAVKASAGFSGPEVRGDCRATVWEPVGMPELTVNSRVDALYGKSIAAQAAEVLEQLGASKLSLNLEDDGALPFTIAARIESAVRLILGDKTAPCLPQKLQRMQGAKDRPRRTRLYLPGNTPKFFINAGLYGADAIILDLEDSVPAAEKDAARILVRNALASLDFMASERMVRINSGDAGDADLEALNGQSIDAIIVPKAELPEEMVRLSKKTGAWIIPLIETARGVALSQAIADSSSQICAVAFGVEDYLADIGAERSAEGGEAMWAMGQIVNSARAAGVAALGPVHADLDDYESLRERVESMAAMGFEGFSCIHPMQVRHVHSALSPHPEEVERAESQLRGYQSAIAHGKGAIAVDGTMVDAPVAARAERLLRRAGRSV